MAKGLITSWSCNTSLNGFTLTSSYILGQGGEQLTELAWSGGAPSWAHTNVFAGPAGLVATYDTDPSGKTSSLLYFYLADWLGSRRQQTDYAGNPLLTFTSLPYGDGLATNSVASNGAADATEHHFTGKERDAESGNDYFGARYYASSMGRWLSSDPSQLVFANLTNPQALNLYAYVMNNPLRFIDPTGLYCDYSDPSDPSSGFDSSEFDYKSNSSECSINGGQWDNDAYTKNRADVANRPQYAVSALSTPPAPGTDPQFDIYVAMDQQWLAARQPQAAPTSDQYIKAIALAAPTICGGGAFAYGGRSLDAGPANGFAGTIVAADSKSGVSKGAIFEGGGGEGVVGGGGYIVSNGNSGLGSEGFAFGGAGVELPGAHASVGEVGFTSGIGVYGDVSAGGREVGAGAYLNVTSNAVCMAAKR